jgi:DNA replication protein DnaC
MNSPISCEPSQPETVSADCAKHGTYQAKRFVMLPGTDPIVSGCPRCQSEHRTKREESERAETERARLRRIETLTHESCIPARYIGCTLDTFRTDNAGQKRALEIARRYVESFPSRGASLVLCGKPGTGKTHLACAIAQAMIDQLRSAMFATVISAIRHIKDTYRKDSERSETDAVNDFLRPDLLILDEIGAQVGSDHEKMLLFEIINERYQDCLPTILISNLNADELKTYLGDRVMDRFRESGAIVAFDWASYRGKRP